MSEEHCVTRPAARPQAARLGHVVCNQRQVAVIDLFTTDNPLILDMAMSDAYLRSSAMPKA